jgi:hypothetical protein|tara:strand:+ start:9284 stop:10372 length:1089 start_codon:yes stop_codon:yes gene_type:complete
MPILKGQVQSQKFTTAEISDSDNRIHYVPIKHTIGNYFLVEIDDKYFAFTLEGARYLTHRSKTGIGKSFQVVQFDTSHAHCLNPTTKELEIMLKENSLPKMDRTMHEIFKILARREKDSFGLYLVGEEQFESKKAAEKYLDSLDKKTFDHTDKNGIASQKQFTVIHDIHTIESLVKIFEDEKGEFPDKVREIKKYLSELDVRHIVTPLRRITDFIHDDLISTSPSFLGEAIARFQRLDGTLRSVTNVPVKPKTNISKYLMVALVIGIAIAGVYGLSASGALDGVFDFVDNLGTIQEGFKDTGLGSIGTIQRSNTGGIDYSDATLMAKYPDCHAMTTDINAGLLDVNKLSTTMQGFVESCPKQ